MSASRSDSAPLGSGRARVRAICSSMRRSSTWLMVAASACAVQRARRGALQDFDVLDVVRIDVRRAVRLRRSLDLARAQPSSGLKFVVE